MTYRAQDLEMKLLEQQAEIDRLQGLLRKKPEAATGLCPLRSKCPKCGGEGRGREYCRRFIFWGYEYISAKCRDCDFEWREQTLDLAAR